MHQSRSHVSGRHPTTYGERVRQRRQGVAGRIGQFVLFKADWRKVSPGLDESDRFGWATGVLDYYGTKRLDWAAGDGTTPAVGPSLTITGAPIETHTTPFKTPSGADIKRAYLNIGDKYEKLTGFVEPEDNEDIVVVTLAQMDWLICRPVSTHDGSSRGFQVAYNRSLDLVQAISYGDTTAVCNANLASGAIGLSMFVVKRGGDQRLFMNGILASTVASPTGSLKNGYGGICLGALVNNASVARGGICRVLVYCGQGLADQITNSYALSFSNRVFMNTTHSVRKDRICTPNRNTHAAFEVGGVWYIYGNYAPRISYEYGYLGEGSRTNELANVVNPGNLNGWSVTAGSLGLASDYAAMLAAGIINFGPLVVSYTNSSGSDQLMYSTTAVGDTAVRSIQTFIRTSTFLPAGVEIGWREPGVGYTKIGDISGDYTRDIFNNLTPPSTTVQFCILVPNGVTIYRSLVDMHKGQFASTPVLSYPGASGSVRAQDLNPTTILPSDIGGTIRAIVKSMGWSGITPANAYFLTSSLGSGYWLYISAGGYRMVIYDGTNAIQSDINVMTGLEQVVLAAWGSKLRIYIEGKGDNSTDYDGAMSPSGTWGFANRNAASPFAYCHDLVLLRNEDRHLV